MAQFLANVFAAFATLPFITFFVIYFVAYIRTKSKKESVRWAVHITMLLLLFTVSQMFKAITGSAAGFWWMIIVLVIIAGLVLFLQWKIRQQIQLGRVVRSVWYAGFLLFSLAYFILIPVGIIFYYGKS